MFMINATVSEDSLIAGAWPFRAVVHMDPVSVQDETNINLEI